jgi:hypothetical protein
VLVAGLILAVVCVVGGIAFVVLDRHATINRGARVFDAIAMPESPTSGPGELVFRRRPDLRWT